MLVLVLVLVNQILVLGPAGALFKNSPQRGRPGSDSAKYGMKETERSETCEIC